MDGCCCGSRTSTRPAAGRNTRPAIYEDLAWLGITFAPPVRRQSEHYDDYRAALAKLDAMDLIYPSFESRAEIALAVGQIPTVRHFMRAPRKCFAPPSAPAA